MNRNAAEAAQLGVVLNLINSLDAEPDKDIPFISQIKQPTRNRLWRVSHPYDPDVAVRAIIWFRDDRPHVLVAAAGNKLDNKYRDPKTGQNLWYDFYVPLADDAVDDVFNGET